MSYAALAKTIYINALAVLYGGSKNPRPLYRLASAAAVAQRRQHPIMAYIGLNGAGKTATMIRDTLPSLERGRKVLSTVAILDPDTGLPHPNYIPFTDWHQLLDADNCDVLMDEMTGVANSRESNSLPGQIQLILGQLRKRNVLLRWSAPDWGRADVIIRNATWAVTYCVASFSDKTAIRANPETGEVEAVEIRLWAPNRLFRVRTYPRAAFETWSATKVGKLEPIVSEYWWGPASRVFDSYDTLAEVSRLGHGGTAGVCVICEGTRRRHECTCDDYTSRKPRRARTSVSADA